MKKKHLLNLPFQRAYAKVFSLFVALMLLATSVNAQIQPDKLRVVPTVDGDATTEFLVATHLTDTLCAKGNFVPDQHCTDEGGIINTQGNDFMEYQITTTETGLYSAVFGLSSQRADVECNASVYEVDGTFEMNGTTYATTNGSWTNPTEYNFPINLEAGKTYVLRLTQLGNGSNVHSLRVDKLDGPTDSSLKEIMVNGEAIKDFDPEVLEYYIPLPEGVGLSEITATATDETATVNIAEVTPVGHKTAVPITVTSQSGLSTIYTVVVVEPILVDDLVELLMASDAYYINGVGNEGDSKLNAWSNGEYIDYYVISPWDENYYLHTLTANNQVDSKSYLNVSTLGLDDTTWTYKSIYSQFIETTYNENQEPQWQEAYAQEYKFVFSLKANEPTLLRIYAQTDRNNVGDTWGLSFSIVNGSIDATLSDIQVNGVTIEGFDPEITNYKVTLPVGTTSVTTSGSFNDSGASSDDFGAVTMEGLITSDTILVVSESGFSIPYTIDFISPLEVNTSDSDTLKLGMTTQLYDSYGVRVTNSNLLNYWFDAGYVEYYIYSEVNKDVFVRANIANGFNILNEVDTLKSYLNVSTYKAGDTWELKSENTYLVPNTETWDAESAEDMDWNLSLVAGEAVLLRFYGQTNGVTGVVGDIQSISIIEGSSDYQGTIPNSIDKPTFEESTSLKVFGGPGTLTVLCDEDYVGGTVQIYDISGNLVKSEVVSSINKVYSVNQRGLYIVRVISKDNAVKAAKCIVQ